MDKKVKEKIGKRLYNTGRVHYQHNNWWYAKSWEETKPEIREKYCKEAKYLIEFFESLGYVQLAPDQGLPTQSHNNGVDGYGRSMFSQGYGLAQQDMLTEKDGTVWAKVKCPDAGFKKVKK